MTELTRDALAARLEWDDHGTASATVAVHWAGREAFLRLIPDIDDESGTLTDTMWVGVLELLGLAPDQVNRLKELVFQAAGSQAAAHGLTGPGDVENVARLELLTVEDFATGPAEATLTLAVPWESGSGLIFEVLDGHLSPHGGDEG